jgi:hypothetical protein
MTVMNDGNVTLYDIALDDEFLEISQGRSSLSPGESFTINATYETSDNDVPGFENIAVAEGYVHLGDGDHVIDSDSVTVTVGKSTPPNPPDYWKPSIEVSISTDKESVNTGEDVVFTMTVSNKGNTVLYNVSVVNGKLGFETVIPTLYILGSETFTVTENMDKEGNYTFSVTAEGTSPQGKNVADSDSTTVAVRDVVVPPTEPQPGDPPEPPVENPETGGIPFDIYSVSGLVALGAGIFALVKREKEAEEDEDYDL